MSEGDYENPLQHYVLACMVIADLWGNTLRIFGREFGKKKPGIPLEEIANGLIDVAAIYQWMNDLKKGLKLLKKALKIYNNGMNHSHYPLEKFQIWYIGLLKY
jgi:hypothetical protein